MATELQQALDAYWEILCSMEADGHGIIFMRPIYYEISRDYRLHCLAYPPESNYTISLGLNVEEKFLLLSFVCNMLESELEQQKEENAAPRYEHDCERCVSLGVHGKADLYYCQQGRIAETVIARYSSDGPDYASGIRGAEQHPYLGEALRRATQRGYYKGEGA